MISKAYDGIDRPRLATLTVMNAPLPVCPMARPAGTATRMAAMIATAESTTCSTVRLGMPPEPLQFAGSMNHATTLPIRSTAGSSRSGPPSPRRREASDGDDDQVQGDREQDGHDRADIHGGRVPEVEPAQHQLPEAALPDERGDHDEPDRGDRRDPQSGDDQRHGQREVHPEQAAPPRVAHAVGGFGDVALHRIKAAHDAPDQDQQRSRSARS